MHRIAQMAGLLTGWRRYGVALVAGALAVLAFAPLHFWPVMFISIPALIWLLDGCYGKLNGEKNSRRIRAISFAWTGWWFGFGFFLVGLYWVGFAFLVEAEVFAFLLPVAVTLLPAGLGLFFAAATAAASLLWRPGFGRILGLAMTITVTEWLRGNVLTGFPWNTIGYALTGSEAMMQSSSLVGVYSLTFFTILLFAMPALLWANPAMCERKRMLRFGMPVALLALLGTSILWGHMRLDGAPTRFVDGARLRIVQPNIAQEDKWKPENRAAIFQRYLQVSQQKTLLGDVNDITHLIWPESAVPFLLAETPEALSAISGLMPKGATFMTGAARAERGDANSRGNELKVYNSLYVMDDKAEVISIYDKAHLVPFGEYLPFQQVLEKIGLSQLTRIKGGFAPGHGSRMLKAPNLPDFLALICYEIIFSDHVREPGTTPGWMLNVTNDAWFGNSAGPYQHFHQARVRGVEQGLPVVRAANNGISAVIDSHGRIIARLPRNTARALDTPLPVALPETVFAKWGQEIFLALLILALMSWLAVFRSEELNTNSQA